MLKIPDLNQTDTESQSDIQDRGSVVNVQIFFVELQTYFHNMLEKYNDVGFIDNNTSYSNDYHTKYYTLLNKFK